MLVTLACAATLSYSHPALAGESFMHRNPKVPEAAPYGRSLDSLPRHKLGAEKDKGEAAPVPEAPDADGAAAEDDGAAETPCPHSSAE